MHLANTRIYFPSEDGMLGEAFFERPPASALDISRVDMMMLFKPRNSALESELMTVTISLPKPVPDSAINDHMLLDVPIPRDHESDAEADSPSRRPWQANPTGIPRSPSSSSSSAEPSLGFFRLGKEGQRGVALLSSWRDRPKNIKALRAPSGLLRPTYTHTLEDPRAWTSHSSVSIILEQLGWADWVPIARSCASSWDINRSTGGPKERARPPKF
ncbi:hypothetical protein CSAL01_06357 [Colletotrichum salicis]|uniref:Uncharacterized protein n=1 Tax=Colletotrichum salicis TaxID=1209931 RepID=A0A135TAX4_9PEZI|nr:hypothetical protein CSAL01_06357 [Colletotrichum salicis]